MKARRFDPDNAHQAGGQYHYHANPTALRYQLGDHVDFNAADENLHRVHQRADETFADSRLGGRWLSALRALRLHRVEQAGSGVRRMVSGYVFRNGQLRHRAISPPTAAPRFRNGPCGCSMSASNQAGPAVSTAYPLGRYMEDNDYLGDHGYARARTHFDLDEYNGRWCVTPEFPNGTYAYFVGISATARRCFLTTSAAAITAARPAAASRPSRKQSRQIFSAAQIWCHAQFARRQKRNGDLKWSAIEGGSYQVEATTNLANSSGWTVLTSSVAPNQITGGYTNVTAL